MEGFDIRYNNITGNWEVWEGNELYYDTYSMEDAHRVYYNCIMLEPQFEDEIPEESFEDNYESFNEINMEVEIDDREDTDLLFISQIL